MVAWCARLVCFIDVHAGVGCGGGDAAACGMYIGCGGGDGGRFDTPFV